MTYRPTLLCPETTYKSSLPPRSRRKRSKLTAVIADESRFVNLPCSQSHLLTRACRDSSTPSWNQQLGAAADATESASATARQAATNRVISKPSSKVAVLPSRQAFREFRRPTRALARLTPVTAQMRLPVPLALPAPGDQARVRRLVRRDFDTHGPLYLCIAIIRYTLI